MHEHRTDEEGPASGSATPPPAAGDPPTARFGGLARTLLLGAATALAFVVGAAVTGMVTNGGSSDLPAVADNPTSELEGRVDPTERAPLPETTLDAFADGDRVDLARYRGRPLVVNFWASWCAPCVKEMPDFETVARDLDGEVPVLGVNVQDAPANAEAFADELGISYDLAADPKGEFYAAVDAFGMPTTLFVDDAGTIVYRYTGLLEEADLRDLVAEHLGVEA